MDRKSAFLARPLESFRGTAHEMNGLISYAMCARGLERIVLTPKSRRELAAKLTAGDVLMHLKTLPPFRAYHGETDKRFVARMVKAGFTRFDLICLPQKTLTRRLLKSKSKEEWLEMPADLLGTMTPSLLEKVAAELDKKIMEVTVRDLLSVVDKKKGRWMTCRSLWRNNERSMTNTQKLLYELGFCYEDSPIMRYKTAREAAEYLMSKYKIGNKTARVVVRIADAEGRPFQAQKRWRW